MPAFVAARAFGRIQAFIPYAAESLVLALADTLVVKVLALEISHLDFSMWDVRLFS